MHNCDSILIIILEKIFYLILKIRKQRLSIYHVLSIFFSKYILALILSISLDESLSFFSYNFWARAFAL